MIGRMIDVIGGLLLIVLEFGTFKDVVRFYMRPGTMPLQLELLRTKQTKLLDVLVLNIGAAYLISAFLPISKATSILDLPKNVIELIPVIVTASVLEEVVFRIVPWIFLFALRMLTKRNIWLERTSVIVALVIAIVFGLAHIGNYTNPDTGTYLGCLIQVTAALLYWYILEKDGLVSSTIVHIIFNLIIILSSIL